VREYYDARADEYDDWWLGKGLFAERPRPGWFEEVLELAGVLSALPAARTLDVACGTGFLTRFLHGEVVGIDQSAAMLRIAKARVPNAQFIQGDAFELPFAAASFDRVVAGHFYGHLEEVERARALAEPLGRAPPVTRRRMRRPRASRTPLRRRARRMRSLARGR
jgi:demethylmenaquinone methyltransferase/2-methoxy-6-polyprenyl-1,4-benzoquinol methylase